MGRSKANPLAILSHMANVVIVVVVVAALYLAQDVFIPLTLSTMLAFLLAPLADRLESRGLGRVPAVLVIAVLAFSIIGGFVWVVGREATKLASNIPQYQTEIVTKVERFTAAGSGASKRLTEFVTAVTKALRGDKGAELSRLPLAPVGPIDDLDAQSSAAVAQSTEEDDEPAPLGTPDNPLHTVIGGTSQSSVEAAVGTVAAILNPLTTVGLVLVFTIFMLVARDDLRDRLIRVLSGGRYIVTTKAIDEASRRISRYIVAQTIVNSCYGLCIGLGLWIIGVTLGGDTGFPNYALWGLLCTVLRFVPYVGPVIAGAFPVALSLIVFPGFTVFLATATLFVAIELLSNNVLEPWLYGSSTGMSAMAIIVAAVFWTWMWGPVGLLLATPLTASLVVMGKYVPQLRFLTVMLGDKTPLPPFVSFYQRLLADDSSRAAKILEGAIEEDDLESAADELLLPTLRRVRRDRAREELSAQREHKLMNQITEMIDDVLERQCQLKTTGECSDKNSGEKSTDGVAGAADPATNAAAFESGSTEVESSAAECAQRVAQAVHDVNVADREVSLDSAERFDVVGCTAHHESEEPALKLLSYCLSEHGIDMRWTGTKALPTDVETWMETNQPKVIVIAIVPPDGFVQAKFLCERLHRCVPKAQIIVAYFGKLRSYDTALVRFRKIGAAFFTTSLSQTRIQVLSSLERPVPITQENRNRLNKARVHTEDLPPKRTPDQALADASDDDTTSTARPDNGPYASEEPRAKKTLGSH